ncbi:MAG TPA: RDD family protein [Candidatus Acidoferrales bacterium]|nr:RDD family protein [Candidatus Acidoferrales bacterium]
MAYGGFWRRFAAGFVDLLVFLFPNAALRALIGLPSMLAPRPMEDADTARFIAMLAVGTLAGWLYCAGLESSRWQGTLGQQLLDLRVATLEGHRVSLARASARYFAQFFSYALCGTGFLFNLWTPRRQTLHDLLSGCVIVRPAASAQARLADASGRAG